MPLPPNKRISAHPRRRLANLLVLFIWLTALALVAANRQDLIDWWRLRDYNPPQTIAKLASETTMNDFGRRIFYVNYPELINKSSFKKSCPTAGGEQTIVLGCYHSGQSGIFLLDVNDPRLEGVEQVTAAHEMLHGAYERLSGSERKRVDKLLQNYYDNDLKDERIRSTIDAYKKTEPNDLVNEMHSIFATEVATLPAALEEYYSRYFSNRAQVVAFGAQYQAEFTSRRALIVQYDAQLADLKSRIDNLQTDLKSQQVAINNRESTLVAQRNSGEIAAYNAGVPVYNGMVNTYNAGVRQVQALIEQYNQLVTTRNAVALEEDQLVKDLSTDVAPINN